ncbi:cation-transporting ATPase, P-type, partial [Lactobacillus helveticus MTCC 5463]
SLQFNCFSINLVTDSLPALAIGMEPGSPDVLSRKPRDPKVGILDKSLVTQVAAQGVLISVGVICAFMIGQQTSPAVACTMAFSTLTFARLLHGFNCRSQHSILNLALRTT